MIQDIEDIKQLNVAETQALIHHASALLLKKERLDSNLEPDLVIQHAQNRLLTLRFAYREKLNEMLSYVADLSLEAAQSALASLNEAEWFDPQTRLVSNVETKRMLENHVSILKQLAS